MNTRWCYKKNEYNIKKWIQDDVIKKNEYNIKKWIQEGVLKNEYIMN